MFAPSDHAQREAAISLAPPVAKNCLHGNSYGNRSKSPRHPKKQHGYLLLVDCCAANPSRSLQIWDRRNAARSIALVAQWPESGPDKTSSSRHRVLVDHRRSSNVSADAGTRDEDSKPQNQRPLIQCSARPVQDAVGRPDKYFNDAARSRPGLRKRNGESTSRCNRPELRAGDAMNLVLPCRSASHSPRNVTWSEARACSSSRPGQRASEIGDIRPTENFCAIDTDAQVDC